MLNPFLAMLVLITLAGCGGDPAENSPQAGRQEYDLAIRSCEKTIARDPKNAAAYNLMGMAYRFKYDKLADPGLKQKEIEAFQKAIEVDPNYWVAMINLGATYYRQGEKAKAAPLFKRVLALNPQHPEKAQLEKMIAAGEGKK